jgi:hypothetical protein
MQPHQCFDCILDGRRRHGQQQRIESWPHKHPMNVSKIPPWILPELAVDLCDLCMHHGQPDLAPLIITRIELSTILEELPDPDDPNCETLLGIAEMFARKLHRSNCITPPWSPWGPSLADLWAQERRMEYWNCPPLSHLAAEVDAALARMQKAAAAQEVCKPKPQQHIKNAPHLFGPDALANLKHMQYLKNLEIFEAG